MKFSLPICEVNVEALGAQLLAALGGAYVGMTFAGDEVTIHVRDGDEIMRRAREIVAVHDASGLTVRQRRVKALEKEIRSIRKQIGLTKPVAGLARFQSMDAGALAAVVYLLWLLVEGGELAGREE